MLDLRLNVAEVMDTRFYRASRLLATPGVAVGGGAAGPSTDLLAEIVGPSQVMEALREVADDSRPSSAKS